MFASNYGYVLKIGKDPLGGKYIILEHRIEGKPLRKTKYFHLAEVKIEEGEYVYKGQLIGLIGHTGMVTGQHLDFSLQEWDGRRWINKNALIGTTHNRKWMRGYFYYRNKEGKWRVKIV